MLNPGLINSLTDTELRVTPVPVLISPGTGVVNGQTNVATAGVAVVVTTTQAVLGVQIRAKRTNTGNIYVGKVVELTEIQTLQARKALFITLCVRWGVPTDAAEDIWDEGIGNGTIQ